MGSAAQASHGKSRVALYSVIVGIVLTGMKLVIGLATGSLGILSEAAHSLLDLGAALITFFAVRISSRPPDSSHQYGHGKVENLSALAEALLLLGTCVWIVYEALERLLGKAVVVEATAWSFVIMIVAIALDIYISRALAAGAKKFQSQALEADALHYSSDILSSAVVLLGLVGVRLGYPWLDPVAALGVAVLVAIASVRLTKRTIDGLLDRAPSGLLEQVRVVVVGIPGVQAVEQMRIRPSGSTTFIDLVVAVRRQLAIDEGDALADTVEAAIKGVVSGSDVIVHLHPTNAGESVVDTVRAVARRFPHIKEVHNLQCFTKPETGRYRITMHVLLERSWSLAQAHQQVDELEAAIQQELPLTEEVITHLESSSDLSEGTPIALSPEQLVAIESDVRQDPRLCGIHDMEMFRCCNKTVFSCHIVTADDLPLESAHAVSTAVEDKVRRCFNEVDEVVVHAEPAGGGEAR